MTVFAVAADGYRTNATSSIDRAIRLSTAAAVLALAGIAAYVSYWHAYAIVGAHGESGISGQPRGPLKPGNYGLLRRHGFLREGASLAAEAGDDTSAAYYLEGLAAGRPAAGQPAAGRAPARSRALAPGIQGQRLAARIRATCPERRRCPCHVALRYGRCGIRRSLGVGRVRRGQARTGIRTGATTTRLAPVTGPAENKRHRRPRLGAGK